MRTDLERKLYNACLHAFQWHCGTGTPEAENECIRILGEAIREAQEAQGESS